MNPVGGVRAPIGRDGQGQRVLSAKVRLPTRGLLRDLRDLREPGEREQGQ